MFSILQKKYSEKYAPKLKLNVQVFSEILFYNKDLLMFSLTTKF